MYRFESSGPLCGAPSNLDLQFFYCGTIECDDSRWWGPALRDHYRLHFITSGRGRLTIGDRGWDLAAGDCFVVPPDTLTCYQPLAGQGWAYYWVAFNGLNAQAYLRRAGFSTEHPVRPAPDSAGTVTVFERMFAVSQHKASGDLLLLAELYQVLAGLVDSAPTAAAQSRTEGRPGIYVAKAIEWLQINYPRDITIAELVTHIGLNGKYFSRIFKQETGLSPQAFLINLRLNKGCLLLMDQRLSIGDIARSVGYPDQLLFSRMFKRIKGASPVIWRRGRGGTVE